MKNFIQDYARSGGKAVLFSSLLLITVMIQPAAWAQNQPDQVPATNEELEDALRNVSTKFRFLEKYNVDDMGALPGEISQTRNAFKETLSMTVSNPKGDPVKSERTRQVIYSERPAIITGTNRVDAVVRRFEALRFDPPPQGIDMQKDRPLEELVVYAVKGVMGEQIVSLTENRSITDFEHQVATSVPTLLNFSDLLPPSSIRLGDSWQITKGAARVLLGRGQVTSTKLVGTLEKVQPDASAAGRFNAVVTITGQVITDLGTCSLNLSYQFDFAGSNAREEELAVFGAKQKEKVVTAMGGISKMSFAQIEVADVPGSEGRIKQVFDRSLVYQRQFDGRQQPLAVPSSPPQPTKENSWLVFEDPKQRFMLRHPPVFKPQMDDENSILFVTAGATPEFLRLDLDASSVNSETFRKELEDEWKTEGFEVFAVTEGPLDDPKWTNSRVYRVEAALQATDTGSRQRGHFDAYIMQFPMTKTKFLAEAMTYSDQSNPFRDLIEEVLQTVELLPEPATLKK